MKIPKSCDPPYCMAYEVCSLDVKKGDRQCRNFQKLVEEKFTPTNNAMDEIVALYGSWRVANPNVDASLVDSFVSWVQQHSPIAY